MPWFVPGFPQYSGPYDVGSCDVELPVHKLDSPSPKLSSEDIGTVAFRIFYPCVAGSRERAINWVPRPQRGYLSAYARFLGAGSLFSEAFSLFPQLLYHTTIPAHRNAQLLPPPTSSRRWPVMIFSHGLGGSRNAYSQILGLLASYGIVVIAADHRDGSAPTSYIRATEKTKARIIEYQQWSHTPTPEVYAGRDEQLKIRLWELGLIHDTVHKIDSGHYPENLDPNSSSTRRKDVNDILKMFVGSLDIQRPGSIVWGGHSFGAATVVQLLKATYWQTSAEDKVSPSPISDPSPESSLSHQITPSSPAVLLDVWCLPFRSPETQSLWAKPMPCYAPSGPGGGAILSILSEAFYKWSGNCKDTKRIIAPPTVQNKDKRPGPWIFYPTASAHLSQSDFGILFPWITKKFLKTEDPERYIKLNARAVLQMLREQGYEVADTCDTDMEKGGDQSKVVQEGSQEGQRGQRGQDWKILDTSDAVPGWIAIDLTLNGKSKETVETDARSPADSVMESEMLGEVKL